MHLPKYPARTSKPASACRTLETLSKALLPSVAIVMLEYLKDTTKIFTVRREYGEHPATFSAADYQSVILRISMILQMLKGINRRR